MPEFAFREMKVPADGEAREGGVREAAWLTHAMAVLRRGTRGAVWKVG
jgi:hypothetical protein